MVAAFMGVLVGADERILIFPTVGGPTNISHQEWLARLIRTVYQYIVSTTAIQVDVTCA